VADLRTSAPAPDITAATISPFGADTILVHLVGRWPGRARRTPSFAALLVEVDGRRQRFPELVAPQKGPFARRTAWSASFALPARLGPHLAGSASLVVGGKMIPLPPPEERDAPPTTSVFPAPAEPAGDGPEPVSDLTPHEPAASDAVLTGEEAVLALRTELDARTASEAELRGRLADTQSQLEARAATQERLESAHAALRDELESLRERVARGEEERARAHAEMRAELTATVVSRDAALSEASGLRAELERLAGELTQARAQTGLRDAGVDEAERLLAEARALNAALRDD
jgi:hypothetical protein